MFLVCYGLHAELMNTSGRFFFFFFEVICVRQLQRIVEWMLMCMHKAKQSNDAFKK